MGRAVRLSGALKKIRQRGFTFNLQEYFQKYSRINAITLDNLLKLFGFHFHFFRQQERQKLLFI